MAQQTDGEVDPEPWSNIVAHVGGNKKEEDVLYVAHHMLQKGVQKSERELQVETSGGAGELSAGSSAAKSTPGRTGVHLFGAPAFGSFDNSSGICAPQSFGSASLPNMPLSSATSLFERSFRTPKEPRITVWHPDTGKTISGNAAPCRRNLEAWMAQHPGWRPKGEDQLSSSRRTRGRKSRPTNISSVSHSPSSFEAESPIVVDAVQGLLGLSESPSRHLTGFAMRHGLMSKSLNLPSTPISSNPQREEKKITAHREVMITGKQSHTTIENSSDAEAVKKVVISSVSSTSSEGDSDVPSGGIHEDNVKMDGP